MSRILLASPYLPPRLGGVERYAARLAAGLAGRGHEVLVVTTAGGRDLEGCRVIELPARFRVSATPLDPRWVPQIRRLMARERPDVVITHAPVPGLADVCLATRGAVPAIATYHSGSMRKGGSRLDPAIGVYERAVLPRLLRAAEAVVTTYPSRAAGGVESRYVPPGVDTAVFHPDPATGREPGLVLYAGRIEHASAWKGIGTLLEAVRLLARSDPSVRLELAGGGDALRHYADQAARMGLNGRVRFSGPLRPAELADSYRRASVVVLPSETDAEAFGMVLIEAMACGTPVVASRIGGMPAVLADTGGGVLAEPGDPQSLAAAISGLLADPGLRARLAARGLARVTDRYHWDAVTDAYHELIETLTKEGRHLAASSR